LPGWVQLERAAPSLLAVGDAVLEKKLEKFACPKRAILH
jgi:hypothetical protein